MPQLPEDLTATPHRLKIAKDGLLYCQGCAACYQPVPETTLGVNITEVYSMTPCGQGTPWQGRGLSTKQPWAGMISRQEKTLEIRSWYTKHRGDLLIMASLKADKLDWLHPAWSAHQAPCYDLGAAICLVELYDCRPMVKADEQAAQCPYEPGLFAWCLRHVRPVEPVPVKGGLGLLHLSLLLNEK